MEKIPTASILVRAKRAPTRNGTQVLSVRDVPASEWESTGLVEVAPDYGEGDYCTIYCVQNDVELDLYDQRLKRFDPPMQHTLNAL